MLDPFGQPFAMFAKDGQPIATIVITAPTPMMMPSIVSIARNRFARIDCSATITISPNSMRAIPTLSTG